MPKGNYHSRLYYYFPPIETWTRIRRLAPRIFGKSQGKRIKNMKNTYEFIYVYIYIKKRIRIGIVFFFFFLKVVVYIPNCNQRCSRKISSCNKKHHQIILVYPYRTSLLRKQSGQGVRRVQMAREMNDFEIILDQACSPSRQFLTSLRRIHDVSNRRVVRSQFKVSTH